MGALDSLALGVLMMIADVIPLVGPLLGTVPAVLMALSGGPAMLESCWRRNWCSFRWEGSFIVPRVYGNALKLSPFIFLVAFLIATTLMGMPGAVLALPVAAAIPIIARYISAWRVRLDAGTSVRTGLTPAHFSPTQ